MKADVVTIEAIGNLLTYYRFDLKYIRSFQICKRYQGDYLTNFRDTMLSRFLADYKVARNLKKGQTERLLKTLIVHVETDRADNVDYLAKKLRKLGITQADKKMVSLASKILFLNNPWEILPCDTLVRRAIGYSGNSYSGYLEAVHKSKERILKLYDALPSSILSYLQLIEEEVASDIVRLERIRKNRFIDKILWTLGRNKMDLTYIDRHLLPSR
jgi:hypothetical protein